MIGQMGHRGPDGSGLYEVEGVVLGHRRLAIIDLSPAGAQPMRSLDGTLAITYNGEIYNYLELRSELEACGHRFRSRSDTEVILVAYAEWGDECVTRFNGMWAFALHDERRRRMFCSRDRFGVKPFHYLCLENGIAICSEIAPLLTLAGAARANRELIEDFLLTSTCDHTDRTCFDRVRVLPGGHNLLVDLGERTSAVRRYYRLRCDPAISAEKPDEAIERYRVGLESAVALRLRSDVRVGTCLSGGLDSSSVATVAAAQYRRGASEPFCAITAVSEQPDNDESRFAERVVAASGLEWISVRPSYEDFAQGLPTVTRSQEQPFAGPSIVMQHYVMMAARNHGIKVLLDGQGGDETLLGYDKYYPAFFKSVLRRQGVAALIGALVDTRRHNANMGWANILAYLVTGGSAWIRGWLLQHRQPYLRCARIPEHVATFARAVRDVFTLQVLESTRTNLPVLLRYEDRNSMAHGVEARLPFLDYRLVERAVSLPDDYKIRRGWTKWILRAAMKGTLPDEIVWRRNKLGFEAPERLWLSRHRARMFDAVMGSGIIRELSDIRTLERCYSRLDGRSRWRLYSVALWEDAFGVRI
jgi:asparagine synthase (glutamine-hydrolysing)